jgi:hypothetical protein
MVSTLKAYFNGFPGIHEETNPLLLLLPEQGVSKRVASFSFNIEIPVTPVPTKKSLVHRFVPLGHTHPQIPHLPLPKHQEETIEHHRCEYSSNLLERHCVVQANNLSRPKTCRPIAATGMHLPHPHNNLHQDLLKPAMAAMNL